MTRYSPIAPIHLLEEMCDKDILGNYLLLLAHDVLDNQWRYAELIKEVRKHDPDSFIIMDNSVIELGVAMGVHQIIEAAHVTGADCIITPDVLGDMEETQIAISVQTEQLLSCGFPLMRVPQGKDNAELVNCITWLRSILPTPEGGREYWGIPRWISNKLGSRIPILQTVLLTTEQPSVHLLGMSDNFDDDMRCTRFTNVMGIDSANPVVTGLDNMSIHTGMKTHNARGNYWETSQLNTQAILNIEYMHQNVGA